MLVAFLIGGIEWLQILSAELKLDGPFWRAINNLNFEQIGMIVVAFIALTWLVAWQSYRRYAATLSSLARQT